jgi:WD40 repeat protein
LKETLKSWVSRLAFSPDGKTLATGSGKTAQLWDMATGQVTATLEGHSHPVTQLAFAPDGKTLATGGSDATGPDSTRLWDLDRGQLKSVLQVDQFLFNLAFSPDGKTLATGFGDGTTRLWDVGSGQLKATLNEARGPFGFSPDGRTLATAGAYRTARLWDVASGQLAATLEGHAYLVTSIAFAPDGKMLATRDLAGKLLLWDVASGKSIPVTSKTSLAQFPAEMAHPISWSLPSPAVSLLDPLDAHVLATLQPLPDALPYLAAPALDTPGAVVIPTRGDEWITTTPDGYFTGSASVAQFIRWNVDGELYPAAAYWDVYYRPDLVRQALKILGE